MRFIDSSIWLAHLTEAQINASEIIESEDILYCSIITLFEVERKLRKLKLSGEKVEASLEFIKNRALIININEEIIHYACEVSVKNQLSALDSLIYASAVYTKALLVTADNDFRGLKNVEVIDK